MQSLLIFSALTFFGCAAETDILCGTSPLNSTEICCGGQIHERFQNSKEMACCVHSGKKELYPKNEKVCCGEQLVPVHRGNRKQCCNKELIDSQTYDCCGDENYGVKFLRTENKLCCTHSETKRHGLYMYKEDYTCCGSLEYHKGNEKCDYENGIYSVTDESTMWPCGIHQFDPAVNVCCHASGKVIPKPKENYRDHNVERPADWVCWNDKLWDRNQHDFDTKTSRVIPKGSRLCGNVTYNPENEGLKCCGSSLRNVPLHHRNITCCGDQLLNLNDRSKQCCGHNIILSSMQGCCDGLPFNRGHDLKCCARALMNRSSHICCVTQSSHMSVLKKQHASHTNCCKSIETGRIQTYNKYEKVCKRGEIVDKMQEESYSTSTSSDKRCPFCAQTIIDKTACSKANVYRFFVYNKRITDHSTVLKGVILQPFLLKNGEAINGEKIRIRTQNLCKCFKMKRNFYLFTNRKIKNFKENKYNVRFTADDVFIAEDDVDSITMCQTYQVMHMSSSNYRNMFRL